VAPWPGPRQPPDRFARPLLRVFASSRETQAASLPRAARLPPKRTKSPRCNVGLRLGLPSKMERECKRPSAAHARALRRLIPSCRTPASRGSAPSRPHSRSGEGRLPPDVHGSKPAPDPDPGSTSASRAADPSGSWDRAAPSAREARHGPASCHLCNLPARRACPERRRGACPERHRRTRRPASP
jgi:hypothetical protein